MAEDRTPAHYCPNCTQVLREDDHACGHCGATAPEDAWPSIQDGFDPWLGRVIDGRYTVMRQIGRGAMGTVYLARSRAISRDFAVKIIDIAHNRPGIAPEQIRGRLQREIDAIGQLRNPHVVLFYEVIELFGNHVGIVMDYIEGPTLEELVHNEGRFDPRRALTVVRQAANGVHEAHELGMIHRDIKPENIMVEQLQSGDEFAHVLDFGIVQTEDGVSMTQGFLGTPLFASPEQCTGHKLDRRSDIYSLGATLFFALTGRPPFVSNNVYEILTSHARETPPRLEDACDGLFPKSLERLVASMLAKNPDDRPATLGRVVSLIDRVLARDDLDELAPDSMEVVGPVENTFVGSTASTNPGLSTDGSSVFESDEHDRTGPKAAIFARRSRTFVKNEIASQRKQEHAPHAVYAGNTGARDLGIDVREDVLCAKATSEGDVVFSTPHGVFVTRGAGAVQLSAEPATMVALSSNNVVAVGADGTARLLGANEVVFDQPGEEVAAFVMSEDDRVWLAATADGRVYRGKLGTTCGDWQRLSDGPPVASLGVRARSLVFAVGRRHGEMEFAYLATPDRFFGRFSVPGAAIRDIAISTDGHLAAVLQADSTVEVHMVETGMLVHRIRDENHELLAIEFCNNELTGWYLHDRRLCSRRLDRPANETY